MENNSKQEKGNSLQSAFGQKTEEEWIQELNNLFDKSVYCQKVRKYHRETIDRIQLLRNYIQNSFPMNCQKIMGSKAEGTSLYYDSVPDIDALTYKPYIHVGDHPVQSVENIPSLYINRDSSTPAGYTKLQIFLNGTPAIEKDLTLVNEHINHIIYEDSYGNIFVTNRINDEAMSKTKHMEPELHGPALTFDFLSDLSFDSVPAYFSHELPGELDKWYNRPRPHGWPPQDMCDLFMNMGFYVVGIGHAKSPQQHLEWRMSLSNQELCLMLMLNPTQYRCYILLKRIKKLITKLIGSETISSYHCKTALFYTIEKSPASDWQEDNIMQCVGQCLQQLQDWISDRNCPNYFLPEENMFATKLTNEDQIILLQEHIDHLLVNRYSLIMASIAFVQKIHSANKAILMLALDLNQGVAMGNENPSIDLLERKAQIIRDKIVSTHESESGMDDLMELICPRNLNQKDVLETLQKALLFIEKTILLQKTSKDGFNDVLSSKAKQLKTDNQTISDMFEFGLKEASVHYKHRAEFPCQNILQELLIASTKIETLCTCYTTTGTAKFKEIEKTTNLVDRISIETSDFDMLSNVSLCLHFEPYQLDMVPVPLHVEAYKSVGVAKPEKYHPLMPQWYQEVTIDPKDFLHFLNYMNSVRIGDAIEMQLSIQSLEELGIENVTSGNDGHPETSLNVLGHIYKTKVWYKLAVWCYRRSWQIKAPYNAAKWHVMFMLFGHLGSKPAIIGKL